MNTIGIELYTVVIGVDDYREHDPTGASDLRGAVNDAASWLQLLRSHLEIPADQIRVLTRRRADVAAHDWGDAARGDATRGAILDALDWLADRVARPGASGLLVFSGHGLPIARASGERGQIPLAICPADIGPDLEGAIAASEVHERLLERLSVALDASAASNALEDLTFVIDASSAAGRDGAGARSLGRLQRAPDPTGLSVTARLMMAGQLGEDAYELPVGGVWRGAFSLALQLLISRWRLVPDDDGGYLNASYGELMHRARGLLDVLEVPQRPASLSSLRGLDSLPLFRSSASRRREGARRPDTRSRALQLDPEINGFAAYELSVDVAGASHTFARVVAIGKPAPAGTGETYDYSAIFTQRMEYWFYSPVDAWRLTQAGSALKVRLLIRKTWEELGPSTDSLEIDAALSLPDRLNPMNTLLSPEAWVQVLSGAPSVVWVGTLQGSMGLDEIALHFSLQAYAEAGEDKAAIGQVVWLRASSTNPDYPLFWGVSAPTSTSDLIRGPLPGAPSGQSWYIWPPPVSSS